MENGKPETRIKFDIKTGQIIPDFISPNLYLGIISSGLWTPDIIILEPYSENLEPEGSVNLILGKLLQNHENLISLASNVLLNNTELSHENSSDIIQTILDDLDKLISEIKNFNETGFIPTLKLGKDLAEIDYFLGLISPYLPVDLRGSFEGFTLAIHDFFSQDFEIKTDIDTLSKNIYKIIASFKNSIEKSGQKPDLLDSIRGIEQSLENFFLSLTVEDKSSENQSLHDLKLISEAFKKLTQNSNFMVDEFDKEHLKRLFIVLERFVDKSH